MPRRDLDVSDNPNRAADCRTRLSRYHILLFKAPAFGTVLLCALFTPFIARYDLLAISIATIAFVVSVSFVLTLRGTNRANPAS